MTHTIYLASQSPRRRELLLQLGVDCIVLPSHIDESPYSGERVEDYVLRLAREKAEVCYQRLADEDRAILPILAADTTVCLDHVMLGKPESELEALSMLQRLSGRWHEVHTAVAVATAVGVETALSTTHVEISNVSEADLMAYIATGEPRDKAGAYGIQGLAGMFIRRIEGSYTGVMGLPIYETAQLLRNAGVALLKHE